jgi:RsiW-degrading membrane proteinase PrsW (M82 family)
LDTSDGAKMTSSLRSGSSVVFLFVGVGVFGLTFNFDVSEVGVEGEGEFVVWAVFLGLVSGFFLRTFFFSLLLSSLSLEPEADEDMVDDEPPSVDDAASDEDLCELLDDKELDE